MGGREARSYSGLRISIDGRIEAGSPNESTHRQTSVSAMLRLLTTIFLISVGIFVYSYFRELNPGTITVHTGPSTQFELSAVTLVVFSMAVGAVLVALAVGMRQTVHVIGNWRSTRLQRRKEKVDALHREGTHAFMSKRTSDAVGLFEKALSIDPNRVDSLSGWGISTGWKAIMQKPSGCTRMLSASTTGISRFSSSCPKTWREPNVTRTPRRRCRRS